MCAFRPPLTSDVRGWSHERSRSARFLSLFFLGACRAYTPAPNHTFCIFCRSSLTFLVLRIRAVVLPRWPADSLVSAADAVSAESAHFLFRFRVVCGVEIPVAGALLSASRADVAAGFAFQFGYTIFEFSHAQSHRVQRAAAPVTCPRFQKSSHSHNYYPER